MITINGVELRNLQEQVLKNKEDIAEFHSADIFINGLGIQFMGTVDEVGDLPTLTESDDDYGKAYAVGSGESPDIYVWSRPNIDAGHPTAYWYNIGPLSVVGPQGPQGVQGNAGPQGVRGTVWFFGSVTPGTISTAQEGDFYLNTDNGNFYNYVGGVWTYLGNLKGPQGPTGQTGATGPQGPTGATGPQGPQGQADNRYIHLVGRVANSSLLPTPAEQKDLSAAYLVGSDNPPDVYAQVGEDIASAVWMNLGPVNTATNVTKNGTYLAVWDSDTKVDKVTENTTYDKVYAKDKDGSQIMADYSIYAYVNTIAQRDSGGRLYITGAIYDNQAARLSQVKEYALKFIDFTLL